MRGFGDYGRDDLDRVGGDLVNALVAKRDYLNEIFIGTEQWTEAVLDFFAARKGSEEVVDARPPRRRKEGRSELCGAGKDWIEFDPKLKKIAPQIRTTYGEFLFDLCISTYPSYESVNPREYWEKSFAEPRELLLVLESEFGKQGAGFTTVNSVMNDATKLLHVQARAKVIVFASSTRSMREQKELLRLAKNMAEIDQTRDSRGLRPNWLWIDIPWIRWDKPVSPQHWVFPEEK